MKRRRAPVVAVLAALLFLRGTQLSSCTEGLYGPTFTLPIAPDALSAYAAGGLGVLEPRFARSYLYVAYRYLNGRPFSDPERSALLDFWQGRLKGRPSGSSAYDWSVRAHAILSEPTARPLEQFRRDRTGFSFYRNCSDDAYRTALEVLDEKVARRGATSGEVRNWLHAQLQVFANCGGGWVIPEILGSAASATDRADRDYQIAAAHFYAGDFGEAEGLFRQIATDPASRWKESAPYLAARCLVRRGTLPEALDSRFDWVALRQAQNELQGILANARLSRSHSAARSLLSFVRFKTEPALRLAELSKKLMDSDLAHTLPADLSDYTLLLDRLLEQSPQNPGFESSIEYDRGQDDLTDWIATLQGGADSARAHAVERWHGGGGDPWLIAVLMRTRATDAWRDEAMNAGARLDSGSPGFATASYHRLRLLCQSGARKDARRLLANLHPEQRADWNGSAGNAFSVLEVSMATTLREFLGAAARRPVIDVRDGDFTWPVLFTPAAQTVLDQQTPIRKLLAAARYESLPVALRAHLALVAWTRAVLVADFSAAERAARQVIAARPAWKPEFRSYLTSAGISDLRFEAVQILLAHPDVTPNVGLGDKNADSVTPAWRIPANDGQSLSLLSETLDPNDPGLPLPLLFSDSDLALARKERAAIATIASAPAFFCREAIRRARSHPRDPRVPETLYRAIQTTRLTLDPRTSAWSRRAFLTLHGLYPSSPWAEKAKYWF